ncbi:carbohydrate-binding module family 1 protein [Cenococcum geophilum 1.58]|uniref:carbohydrate-binding module family 1 protein n=1 Tax=Cenococcum geophilum 1.58 TaxID=794803 RepID=UPI00358F474E|nr:carbohydrate-binding module family 1 protein [Cenococcum geophilum 1.58]
MNALAAVVSMVALASAHGGVGLWQPYNSASGQVSIERQYSSYNPPHTADPTTVNIRCNNAGLTGTGVFATTYQPTSVLVYMAKCVDWKYRSGWDGSGTIWFKIHQEGLVSGTQNAGNRAGGTIVGTKLDLHVIASLAAGEYLIKHELIAVHQANNPQFHPECAQLKVTGSGTAFSDSSYPGINFNIAAAAMTATMYVVPGPSVWPGSDTASGAASAVTTAAGTTTLKTVAVATSAASGGTTGCTVASGSTCSASGDYYSQCR